MERERVREREREGDGGRERERERESERERGGRERDYIVFSMFINGTANHRSLLLYVDTCIHTIHIT